MRATFLGGPPILGDYPIYIYTYVCIDVYRRIDFTALKLLILHMSGVGERAYGS